MLQHPSSSWAHARTAVIGLTTAAVVGASVFAPFSAFAEPISKATQELTRQVLNDPAITTKTDCDKYRRDTFGASALCLVRQGQLLEQQGRDLTQQGRDLTQQGRDLKARERAIDQTNAKLDSFQACADWLQSGITNKVIVQEEMLKIAGGSVDEKNVCNIARHYGYGRKASLTAPSISLSQR